MHPGGLDTKASNTPQVLVKTNEKREDQKIKFYKRGCDESLQEAE